MRFRQGRGVSHAIPCSQVGSKALRRAFHSTYKHHVATLWPGDPGTHNKVTSSANITDLSSLSWALSIELRKLRDMRPSDCPEWDLAKNNLRWSGGAFHTHRKRSKACCGDGRHCCVDSCRSYNLTMSSPQPASLPVLQKQTLAQQFMDP